MRWKQVWTVYGKELRDSLRDRRTLVSMIVFPAVLIPALTFGFASMSFKVFKKAEAEVVSVMILGAENGPALHKLFLASPKLREVPAAKDYVQQISNKQLRAAVEIPPAFETSLEKGDVARVKIYTYGGELKSGFAADELERVLREYRDDIIKHKLSDRGLPASLVRPFDFQRQNVAAPEKVGGNMFGGVIPYVLIMLCFVSAMYPAIDLTAGEKERGTMETILCSPVGRPELVLGKFFTVLTTSLCAVVASLLSMTLSGIGAAAMFSSKAAAAVKAGAAVSGTGLMFNPLGLVGVVIMVIPIAVFFAAVLFTVALFAKNHKEAQTYISPLIIVIVLPSVAAMLPGVELNAKLALIPILNVSLVSKEMISGTFPWGMMALIFGSSCVYGLVALSLAVRMFNRESVLFRA